VRILGEVSIRIYELRLSGEAKDNLAKGCGMAESVSWVEETEYLSCPHPTGEVYVWGNKNWSILLQQK
jgi:hypothetical protein